MKNKAVLTFDLEFWYNSGFLKNYIVENKKDAKDYTEQTTMLLLEKLKYYNQKATFFILGELAEKYPQLVKTIFDAGHEIASHGYSHKSLCELNKETLQKEIYESKQTIENLNNQELNGFRAPNFSLNKKTHWAVEIIKNNFRYDSSIHPLKKNFLKKTILEIAPSLGGIYFRILPLWLYCILLKIFSKNEIPVLYFHLSDLFESTPQIKTAPWLKRKIKYWSIRKSWKKFEKLMKKFNFISIEQYLNENPIN